MRLLDLFCGAGGASEGYRRAGFEVVGVDINPQPSYPFEFHQGDALAFLRKHGREFDAIHASPPCQAYTSMRHLGKTAGDGAPKLVEPVRRLLRLSRVPFVIENVVGSPLINPQVLCGSMFGLGVRRHRLFETSFVFRHPACRHDARTWPVAVWGDGRPSRREARREHQGPIAVYGDNPEDSAIQRAGSNKPGLTRRAATLRVGQIAMGIDWMDWKTLTQAIPPAYTEHVGRALAAAIRGDDSGT